MRGKTGLLVLTLGFWCVTAVAQPAPKTPNETQIYCSGMVTNETISHDTYLISGEQSNYQVTFSEGDYVYINKGSSQGAKVGDEFQVLRPVKDAVGVPWFVMQPYLLREMGTQWMDIGRLRIVVAQPNVSIAQAVDSCHYYQRGDYVRPFEARPAPPLKSEAGFDRFAPATGGKKAMVVSSKDFREEVGEGDIAYVNLGSKQGVKVGDYFRIFRYQSSNGELAYQTGGMATEVYGFGRAAKHYAYDQLPREILGEGIVLQVSRHASTVLITFSLREIVMGSYAELE